MYKFRLHGCLTLMVKNHYSATFVACSCIGLSIVQLLFVSLQGVQVEQSVEAVGAIFSNAANLSNPYLLINSLESLQRAGLISCTTVKIDPHSETYYYDSRYRGGCASSVLLLDGKIVSRSFSTASGQNYLVSMSVLPGLTFQMTLWISRFFICAVILCSFLLYFMRLRLREEIHQLELDKYRILRDAAAQVAHDVSSPLAALKAILRTFTGIEETQLIESVITRIESIASDILLLKKDLNSKSNISNYANYANYAAPARTETIQTVLENLRSEKLTIYNIDTF